MFLNAFLKNTYFLLLSVYGKSWLGQKVETRLFDEVNKKCIQYVSYGVATTCKCILAKLAWELGDTRCVVIQQMQLTYQVTADKCTMGRMP